MRLQPACKKAPDRLRGLFLVSNRKKTVPLPLGSDGLLGDMRQRETEAALETRLTKSRTGKAAWLGKAKQLPYCSTVIVSASLQSN